MGKDSMTPVIVSIVLGFAFTVLLLAVPKLGVAYKCSDQVAVNEPYRRDERGIPLTYVERSLAGTPFCNYVAEADNSPINNKPAFHFLPFLGNIVIWSVISYTMFRLGKRLLNE